MSVVKPSYLGSISGGASTFNVKLDTVAGKPLRTATSAPLYATAKVGRNLCLVATAYPWQYNCVVEPVMLPKPEEPAQGRSLTGDCSSSEAEGNEVEKAVRREFQSLKTVEISIRDGEGGDGDDDREDVGTLTCVYLYVERRVPSSSDLSHVPSSSSEQSREGSVQRSGPSLSLGHRWRGTGTRSDPKGKPVASVESRGPLPSPVLIVHLFLGTSSGALFVCDALHGSILAVSRFIDAALPSRYEEEPAVNPRGSVPMINSLLGAALAEVNLSSGGTIIDTPENATEGLHGRLSEASPPLHLNAAALPHKRSMNNEEKFVFAIDPPPPDGTIVSPATPTSPASRALMSKAPHKTSSLARPLSVSAFSGERKIPIVAVVPCVTRLAGIVGLALSGLYVVHQNGMSVLLPLEALEIIKTTSVSLLEKQKASSGLRVVSALAPPRPSLRLWSITDFHHPIPSVGPAAKYVTAIKEIFVVDVNAPLRSGSEAGLEPAVISPRVGPTASGKDGLVVLHAAQVPHIMCIMSAEGGYKWSADKSPTFLFGGKFPSIGLYRFAQRTTEPLTQTIKTAFTGFSYSVMSMVQRMAGSGGAEAVVPLEKRSVERLSSFFDPDVVIHHVQVDPTNQWGACYAADTGRLFIVDLPSGVVRRVLRGKKSAQFQWMRVMVQGQIRIVLLVLLSEAGVVEIHDLQHTQRLAASSFPVDAQLLPPPLQPDESAVTEVLCCVPASGHVFRLQLEEAVLAERTCLDISDASSQSLVTRDDLVRSSSIEPEASSPDGGTHFPRGNETYLNGSTLTQFLLGCKNTEHFHELFHNIPLPQFKPPAMMLNFVASTPSAEEKSLTYHPSITTGSSSDLMKDAYFSEYVQLLDQIVDWIRYVYGVGESSSRCVPLKAVQTEEGKARVPRMTAGELIHYMQQFQSVVEAYYQLVHPDVVVEDVPLLTELAQTAGLPEEASQCYSVPVFTVFTAYSPKSSVIRAAYRSLSSLIPKGLEYAPTVPPNTSLSPAKSPENLCKSSLAARDGALKQFWKSVLERIADCLPAPLYSESSAGSSDAMVLTTRFFQHLFCTSIQAPYDSISSLLSTSSLVHPLMPLNSFHHYFYCGEERIRFLFLASLHELSSLSSSSSADHGMAKNRRDMFAALGGVVFGQYGLAIFPHQLPALASLGFGMPDLAVITVEWVMRMSDLIGSRAFLAVTPVNAFWFIFSLFSHKAMEKALETIPLVLFKPSAEDGVEATLQQTLSRVEILLMISLVRCWKTLEDQRRTQPTYTMLEGSKSATCSVRMPSHIHFQPAFLTMRRLLRLWVMLSDHGAQLTQKAAVPNPKPFALSLIRFSPPYPETTIMDYLLQQHGTVDSGILDEVWRNLCQRDAPVLTPTDLSRTVKDECSFVYYLSLYRLLCTCGVRSIDAFLSEKGKNNFPWLRSNGIWNTTAFQKHVRDPLRSMWAALTSSNLGEKGEFYYSAPATPQAVESSYGIPVCGAPSPQRLADQWIFLVVLLSTLEAFLLPLGVRLKHHWSSSSIPTIDFLSESVGQSTPSLDPNHENGRSLPIAATASQKSSFLCGSRSTEQYFDALADLCVFSLEVYHTLMQEGEEAIEKSLQRAVEHFNRHASHQVFCTMPSKLHHRWMRFSESTLKKVADTGRRVQQWIQLLNVLQLFVHPIQPEIDGLRVNFQSISMPWELLFGPLNSLFFFAPAQTMFTSHGTQSPSKVSWIAATIEAGQKEQMSPTDYRKRRHNYVTLYLRNFLKEAIFPLPIHEQEALTNVEPTQSTSYPDSSHGHFHASVLTHLQSVDTYRLLGQLGSMLGADPTVSELVILDFHLKYFEDAVFITRQLSHMHYSVACLSMVQQHMGRLLRALLKSVQHKPGNSKVPSAALKHWLEFQRNYERKLVHGKEVKPEAEDEARDAAAGVVAVSQELERSILWFSQEETRTYEALVLSIAKNRSRISCLKETILQLCHYLAVTSNSLPPELQAALPDLQIIIDYLVATL